MRVLTTSPLPFISNLYFAFFRYRAITYFRAGMSTPHDEQRLARTDTKSYLSLCQPIVAP